MFQPKKFGAVVLSCIVMLALLLGNFPGQHVVQAQGDEPPSDITELEAPPLADQLESGVLPEDAPVDETAGDPVVEDTPTADGPRTEISEDSHLVLGEQPQAGETLKSEAFQQETDKSVPSLDTAPVEADPEKTAESQEPSRDKAWNLLMSEGFEGAFPNSLWSVFDNDGATNGEYYWDDDDYMAYSGSWSAWPANGGANALDPYSYYYPNNMNSWMVYGPFDLSNYTTADFEFEYWNQSESGFDYFGWYASSDGVNFNGTRVSGDSGGWRYVDMDLSSYLGDSSVWIAFVFTSDGSFGDDGPFVDNINLWAYSNSAAQAKWTVMVYLDADNNLESAGITDFLEMAAVGSNANINILVEMDRNGSYDTTYDNWSDTRRYRVTYGMTPSAGNGTSIGEANMGDPQTLMDFINWGKVYYPADRYAVILWDHGSGWLRGVDAQPSKGIAYDDTNGDHIDVQELRNALNVVTAGGANPIHLLGMDACLMSMIEVDNQIRPYVSVRVGSQETVPNNGFPYNKILADLVAHPAWTETQLAISVVARYGAFYPSSTTMSAINLGPKYDKLNAAVNSLAHALATNYSRYSSQIQTARAYSQEYSYDFYIDLWSFANQIYNRVGDASIKNAATAVKNAIIAVKIAESHDSNLPGSRGISIYFPSSPSQYSTDYDTGAGFLQFSAYYHWDEFLNVYYGYGSVPAATNALRPSVTVYSPYPTYSWNYSGGADSYTVAIYNALGKFIRGYIVPPSYCNTSSYICSFSPDFYLGYGKAYKWRVYASNYYGNSRYSAFTKFTTSTGLANSFQGSHPGWYAYPYGKWYQSTEYVYTPGYYFSWSNFASLKAFKNFTYEANVYRASPDGWAYGLFVRGSPTFFTSGSDKGQWKKSYQFLLSDGYFSIWKQNGITSTALVSWTSSAYIYAGGWNTIDVVADGPYMDMYINGGYVASVYDASFSGGRVGVTAYTGSSPDYVYLDSAWLGESSMYYASSERQPEAGQVKLVPPAGVTYGPEGVVDPSLLPPK